jgi:hypothetical protein
MAGPCRVEFFEGGAAGAFEGVEAGLKAEEALFERLEAVGKRVLFAAHMEAPLGVEIVVAGLEVVGVEIRFGEA